MLRVFCHLGGRWGAGGRKASHSRPPPPSALRYVESVPAAEVGAAQEAQRASPASASGSASNGTSRQGASRRGDSARKAATAAALGRARRSRCQHDLISPSLQHVHVTPHSSHSHGYALHATTRDDGSIPLASDQKHTFRHILNVYLDRIRLLKFTCYVI